MNQLQIGHTIIWLNEVDSTNNYASKVASEDDSHGMVVASSFQTMGKGQRGNLWESSPGENLLFSIVLKPVFLKVHKQFLISKLVALAICDVISMITKGVSIKWPNDIYINDSKVGGILIENSFSSHTLDSTIVGIGINVNQKHFPEDIPNPTSLTLNTGREHNLNSLIENLCKEIENRYLILKTRGEAIVNTDYYNQLYRRDQWFTYRAQDKTFKAKIAGVKDSGELVLETDTGSRKEFAFKEVSFVV